MNGTRRHSPRRCDGPAAPGAKVAQSVVHLHAYDAAHRVSLVTVDLLTGRTHQIRVHCAHRGAAVANDEVYDAGVARFRTTRGARHTACARAAARRCGGGDDAVVAAAPGRQGVAGSSVGRSPDEAAAADVELAAPHAQQATPEQQRGGICARKGCKGGGAGEGGCARTQGRAERRAGAHRHWHRRNLREKSCDGLPGRARPWHLHKTKRGARCTVRAHGGGGSLGRALHADAARKNARMCRACGNASRAARPELCHRLHRHKRRPKMTSAD